MAERYGGKLKALDEQLAKLQKELNHEMGRLEAAMKTVNGMSLEGLEKDIKMAGHDIPRPNLENKNVEDGNTEGRGIEL